MDNPAQTPDSRITLRFATEKDVGLIYDFICQLAEFEKLEHEVVTNEQILRNSLFGARRVAEIVVASFDDEPAGFALFFHNFSTFLGRPGIYLEDLFVIPKLRGRGVGRVLLSYLAEIAVGRGCGRLEWSVLDWNVDAIRFYKRLGATAMDEWTVFRVTGEALESLASTSSPHS